MNRKLLIFKSVIFISAFLPLIRLIWLALNNQLGANPVEFIIHSLGTWTLVLLLMTLTMSPLRLLTGSGKPLQIRRMLGLFTFFYGSLHLTAYAGLDLWFDWEAILHDVAKHPYVMLGFAAFMLMLPLAVTSNSRSMRQMGKRWMQLHRLIYPIAILAVMHYLWLVKKDLREPLVYAAVLFLLLVTRTRMAKQLISSVREIFSRRGSSGLRGAP